MYATDELVETAGHMARAWALTPCPHYHCIVTTPLTHYVAVSLMYRMLLLDLWKGVCSNVNPTVARLWKDRKEVWSGVAVLLPMHM